MLLIRGPTRRIGPHSMQGVARRVVTDIKRGSARRVIADDLGKTTCFLNKLSTP